MRWLLVSLLLTACISMQTSERRVVLSSEPRERLIGSSGDNRETRAHASIDGAELLLSFAAGSGRCAYDLLTHEEVVVTELRRPSEPAWRVWGSKWSIVGALGGLSAAGGTILLVNRSTVEAQWLGAGLSAVGVVALGEVLGVVIRSHRRDRGQLVEDRPVSTFERACDPTPLATTPLRLRGATNVELVTDAGGQVRIDLRHIDLLRLTAGVWSIESTSGRRLGSLEIPVLPVQSGCEERPARSIRLGALQRGTEVPDVAHAMAASLRTLCRNVVDDERAADFTVVAAVQRLDGVFAAQVSLVDVARGTTLPGASMAVTSVATEQGLAHAIARAADTLVERAAP